MRLVIETDSKDYERREKAARERAAWELGSPNWAGVILGAFLYPDEDKEALKREKAE